MSRRAVLSLVLYVATIVVANLMTAHFGLVPIGFGLLVSAGTFAAGFALVARDWVQVESGRRIVLVAILAGALISALTTNAALALASGIAFLVSELVDLGVFTPLRSWSLPTAVRSIGMHANWRQEHAPAADYIVFHVELHAQVACSHEEMRQFSFELGKQLRRRLTKGISQALDDNEKSAL